MTVEPLFSVIIPSYNRLELLRETLDSVFAQRLAAAEIIVVDDGSTDGTAGYLAGAGVKYVTQDNQGPGATRNTGAKQATGTYLAFLDSDDLWFPWTLEVYAAVLMRCNQPTFVAGKPFVFTHGREFECGQGPLQYETFSDYLASGDHWRWYSASSFIIRRDAFMRSGGFRCELRNGEDADLALRLGVEPGFVQVTSPATFAYREHAGNITHDLAHNLIAVRFLVESEKVGDYPGGTTRSRERRRIIMRHLRPVAYVCARQARLRDAWALYLSTWLWHVAAGAWKFILGLPALCLMTLVTGGQRKG